MVRRGKFLDHNGSSLETREEIVFQYHGQNYPCQHDGFGNFQIEYEPEWVDRILVGGRAAREDWDIGRSEDIGEVFLRLPPTLRSGRIVYEGGEALSGETITIRYRGQDWRARTNDDGCFQLEYPASWVDQVLLGDTVIYEDWDVGEADFGQIEVAVSGEGESGKVRRLRYLYHDSRPAADEEVTWVYREETYRGKTDSDGIVEIEYPHEWVDSVAVGGVEVRRDWDLRGEYEFSDFSLPNPATHQVDGEMYGVSGMVFWSDGTAVDKPLEVRWVDPNGYAWSSEAQGGYCREDGSFLVPFTQRMDPSALREGKWFIGGNEPRFSKRVGASRFFHVLPEVYGGGGGTGGGLVTGHTVDSGGNPVGGVRVRGEVRSNAFLSLIDVPDSVEVRSDKRGSFALGFQGGGALQSIYFNGHPPPRVYFQTPEGEEVDISLEGGLQAGSFSLFFVVPQTGFFSWLTS